MKVLYLVTDDWFFWTHRVDLARSVRDAGCEVVVVTSDGALGSELEAEGFGLRKVRFHRGVPSQPRNAKLLLDLVRTYRAERPDLVHHVSFLPVFYGSLAARLTGVRAVVNGVTGLGHAFIDESRPSATRWLLERAYRLAFRGPGVRVLLENPDDVELLVRRGSLRREAAEVIPGSGVDTGRFAPSAEPEGPPAVVLFSRMLWTKGVGVLVEAGRLLRERGVDHRLVLAGDPHPSNPASIPEDQLRHWHAEGRVEWLGHCRDVPRVIREAHVVCLPTYYREGIPMTLIEGAASGRPLVSTDTPGCREIVRHGRNGLLVPPRDAEALAAALQRLVEDPDLRRRMGREGRELALSEYSVEVFNARMLDIYGRLVGERWVRPRARAGRSRHDGERRDDGGGAPARRGAPPGSFVDVD